MSSLTRRTWLRLSLAAGARASALGRTVTAGAASLASLAAGCDDDRALFGDFAATFEVAPSAALVCVFSERGREATLAVEDELTGVVTTLGPIAIDRGRGGVAVVELIDLVAGRPYRYAVTVDDHLPTPSYRFVTAPSPEASADVSLLCAADIDVSPAWTSPIFDTMVATEADFFLCLGDWPYADNPPGAVTIPEYRARHREAREDPRVQRLLQAMSVYAIYDDHEVRNNWDARFREIERARIEGALAVWDEWFPLRRDDVRYRSARWGQHLECFVLDTRRYRADNSDPDDAAKSMLGADQRQWLIDGVIASTATFKLVATSVPLDFGIGTDSWASFASERDAVLAALAAADVSGLLFLSADQHWFAAHRHASGAREFQTGPLARGIPTLPPLANGVLARVDVYNVGLIEVTGGAAPRLTFTCLDAVGDTLYQESFTPDDLRLAAG